MVIELKEGEVIVLEYEEDFEEVTKRFKTYKEFNDYVFNNQISIYKAYKENEK